MESWDRIFQSAAEELGCPVTADRLRLFDLYRRELLFWNKKMSLLSLKTPEDLPVKHFADSVALLPVMKKRLVHAAPVVLDVGSGAGFPGIPLKIMDHILQVTFIDSSRKKTSFLKEALRKLNLTGTNVINSRVEDVMKAGELRGVFDCVVSRAAFTLHTLLVIGDHFLAPGGILAAMKGSPPVQELDAALNTTNSLSVRHSDTLHFQLPREAGTRSILLFTKTTSKQQSRQKG